MSEQRAPQQTARFPTARSNVLLGSTIVRQQAPHSTFWIWHVAKIARNQVNVHVHPRLPRSLPNVYPDVESVGRVLGDGELMCPAQKLKNRELFLVRHFEEVGHVALRHYENVATTKRVVIRAHIGQCVFGQDRLRDTKLAFLRSFHRRPFRAA